MTEIVIYPYHLISGLVMVMIFLMNESSVHVILILMIIVIIIFGVFAIISAFFIAIHKK